MLLLWPTNLAQDCFMIFRWLFLLTCASSLTADEPRLVSLEKIWDAGAHNAFTDLEQFQGRWFCAFREGSGHAGAGDYGKVRVIASTDGATWQSMALLESKGLDLRDAKLSIMPDGRLLLNSCEYDVDHDRAGKRNNQSITYVSSDGKNWDGPHRVADAGYWLWQTTWRDGLGYALGYQWGTQDATRLYTTTDGLRYETLVDHLRPPGDRSNEHALSFMPDGIAHMLLRRDGGPSGEALLGTSEAPYQDWEWAKLGERMGGPAMLRLPNNRLLTVVRRYGETQWTELGFIDPDTADYTAALKLPSGGDNSYAGLVWHDGLVWMSYYSSHEGKASIYLAKIAIPGLEANGSSYDEKRFTATTLSEGLERPLELDVAPDGRVLFIELEGMLKLYHPDTEKTSIAGELEVFAEQEAGLIGLALAPDFAESQQIYLMYSPPSEVFVGEYVSRFRMNGDFLDRNSEEVILKIPAHRDDCCHHAGSLEFGPEGNLFISTGDNTHPGGDSGGYAPIDEREGRHVFDAQDTSGNTNDLRGKILRIRPMPDGSYTIPKGNLFPNNGIIQGLPEIYVMGCRNPWRMNVDQRTGYVYWGEVGPDAGGEGPRGARGYDEVNQARAAGNFGWPFFIADNQPYADHDYATGNTGLLYDPEYPENRSPTNTGSRILPKPQPAWIFYPYAASKAFPMLGEGGRTACAGPVYHFDPSLNSATKLPAALDNSLIFFDWQRPFIKVAHLDAQSNITSIDSFLTEIPVKRATDIRIGPEGALYMIDYGTSWGVNEDARLLRIDYYAGNRPPKAVLTSLSGNVGKAPFKAQLSAAQSRDADAGDRLSYLWTVKPGSIPSQTGVKATYTFADQGEYEVTLQVTDSAGYHDRDSVTVVVGNDPPSLQFVRPIDGGFFDWDQQLNYQITVSDTEDGDSKDAAETMRSRLLMNQFFETSAPGEAEAAYLAGSGRHAAGLSLIQSSDCLNCHSIDRRIVGPSFTEVAQRYAEAKDATKALVASAERIIKGSSQVWGEVPMLPHAQFTQAQAETMVQWIFSLKDTIGNPSVQQDFQGNTTMTRPEWMTHSESASAIWQASYTDFGGAAPPLTAKAEVRLRSRLVEAEHFSKNQGTTVLANEAASGSKLVGNVSPGTQLTFDHVNLADIKTITARIASPDIGGTVQLRQNTPGGALIAELKFGATGDWNVWKDVSTQVTDPGGLHTLCVVFVNTNAKGPFMNLDWLRFDS